jgi:hypothetical protein
MTTKQEIEDRRIIEEGERRCSVIGCSKWASRWDGEPLDKAMPHCEEHDEGRKAKDDRRYLAIGENYFGFGATEEEARASRRKHGGRGRPTVLRFKDGTAEVEVDFLGNVQWTAAEGYTLDEVGIDKVRHPGAPIWREYRP